MQKGSAMIDPNSSARQYWDLVVTFFILYTIIEIPLRIAAFYEPGGWLLALDALTTAVFVADIVVKFRTSRSIKGRLDDDPRRIALAYLRSRFALDLIVALPGQLLLFGPWRVLWVLRMFKISQLRQQTARLRSLVAINPALIRIPVFVGGIVVLSHWVACGWSLIGEERLVANSVEKYIDCLYWSVTTLTTVGYGDITPHTPAAKLYTMFIMFMGVGMYAYIVGTIARMIAEADYARMQFNDRLDRVTFFMRSHGLPASMRERIQNHFQYLWESRRGIDATTLGDELPEALKPEVAFFLLGGMLRSVSIFKNASDELLRYLAVRLHPVVFGPGDIVVYKGDYGDCMYFICEGKVDVLGDDGTVLTTLAEGDNFGEVALLSEGRRNATVRAREFCDLYSLDRKSFLEVLELFPEFAEEIRRVAAARTGD